MSSAYSTANFRTLPACSFRGYVAPFRSQRVQHRRLTGARVSHVLARRRDSANEEQQASPTGLSGKIKAGISKTISGRAPGTKQLKDAGKSQPKKSEGTFRLGTFSIGGGGIRRTDPNTVFVAGATGRLGCRVVLELLRNKKLKIRAAARDPDEARQLVKTATEYGILPPDAARRITVVPVDLEDIESIAPAIGNAGKVVQAIGAAETKLFDFKAPARVDGAAAIKLVQVAKELNVQQYVMVTSLGTGKFGWPAGLLNLFWGVLIYKKKAEAALEESGIPYVIVRPGGMERPTDTYKRTHNVKLATRDKLFGGQVSRLQVAELIAAAVSSPEAAQNKVLEVVAEENAEGLSYLDLLTAHPSETESGEAESPAPKQEAPVKAATQQVGKAAKQAQQAPAQAAKQVQQAAPIEASSSTKPQPKAKQAPWQSFFGGKKTASKGTDAAGPSSSSTPSLQEAAETAQSGLADGADISIATGYFESAEESEGRRSKIDDALEAAKAERKANAKKNADLLAEQKAEAAVEAKRQEEEDKRKKEQQAKKDAETKAKKEAEAKAAAAKKEKDAKKAAPKPEAKKPEPKAEPKKQPELKAEPKKQPEAKKSSGSDAANTPEAKVQAKQAAQNAKEASEWITNWRDGKTQAKGSGKATQAAAKPAQAAAKPAQAAARGAQQSTQKTQQAGQNLFSNVFGGFKLPWQKDGADDQPQQQAPAAATASSSAPKAAAKKAAEPAKSGDALKQPASGSADTIELRQQQARKWINDWRAESKGAQPAAKPGSKAEAVKAPASGSADTIELRQQQARKWINDWRASTLEKKLPQEVSAKQ